MLYRNKMSHCDYSGDGHSQCNQRNQLRSKKKERRDDEHEETRVYIYIGEQIRFRLRYKGCNVRSGAHKQEQSMQRSKKGATQW